MIVSRLLITLLFSFTISPILFAGKTQGSKAMAAKREDLFPEPNKARQGENRRARPLFLPNLLRDQRFKDTNQDHAYEIICKWADIESSGKLDPMKETSIEGEFCKEIFGEALGYTLFADNKENWNFQQKFSVNGGQALRRKKTHFAGRLTAAIAIF
jgi:hypothetical protein